MKRQFLEIGLATISALGTYSAIERTADEPAG